MNGEEIVMPVRCLIDYYCTPDGQETIQLPTIPTASRYPVEIKRCHMISGERFVVLGLSIPFDDVQARCLLQRIGHVAGYDALDADFSRRCKFDVLAKVETG